MKKLLLPIIFLFSLSQAFAQSSFFQFYWQSDEGVYHNALMSIQDDEIDVWVKYYDADLDEQVLVHQGCYASELENGVAILCNDPTYDGTNIAAYYYADNFFLVQDDYGNPFVFNMDDNERLSRVSGLKELKTRGELKRAYLAFKQ